MSPRPPILLLESDRHFAGALARELTADGYRVGLADGCREARERARREAPRLLLLGRFGRHGIQTPLERLRAGDHHQDGLHPELPVIVLGLEVGGLEALRALEAGADDFMARPLNYLELRARLRAVLRRAPRFAGPELLQAGALRIDLGRRLASLEDQPLPLSRLEFDLLAGLASMPERIFTREELLRSVWGYRSPAATRTIDTHASRLRRKLAAASGERWIASVRGVGYRLI